MLKFGQERSKENATLPSYIVPLILSRAETLKAFRLSKLKTFLTQTTTSQAWPLLSYN
jgi:hypothetical protein